MAPPYTITLSAAVYSTLVMAQELDLGQKLQPSLSCPLDHSALYSASDPSHPDAQSEKGYSATHDSTPLNRPQGDCPDGGLQAWLVVFGASCATFATSGYAVSWGVFQEYYENVLLEGTSPSTIAWIGSVQFALIFFPALISGRLFDLGYLRSILTVASISLVACTFAIAECHEFWQLLLCQGFGIGISSGLVFGPSVSIIAHWFKKRRSTALGINAFASSIGGTVFPILFRNLLVAVGFKWTIRIIASILMLAMGVAKLTLRRRLPPTTVTGGLFNPKQFRSPAYTVYTAFGVVAFLGVFTVLTFLASSAPSQGVPEKFSSYLVSTTNAGNAIGRLAGGVLADCFGPINVMIPASLIAGVLTFVWPHIHGTAALFSLAGTYGASSGAMATLMAAPMLALGASEDVGRRTGMYFTILSLGALAGPPISGAINQATGGYTAVGIFAGCSVMVAVSLLTLSRYFILGGWRGKV
ncbi:MFS general substrate transporter [Lactarius indigo]|nr:MFS general substrate transporter [Lactarius indigo]